MEDDHYMNANFDKDVSLFAIFDGHGGQEVATFCAKNVEKVLKSNKHYQNQRFKVALEETFEELDKLMQSKEGQQELNKNRQTDMGKSIAGCTALVVLLYKDFMFVANAGDCRCLLMDTQGKIYIMNEEHKPQLDHEFNRIKNAGGFVVNGRVN